MSDEQPQDKPTESQEPNVEPTAIPAEADPSLASYTKKGIDSTSIPEKPDTSLKSVVKETSEPRQHEGDSPSDKPSTDK